MSQSSCCHIGGRVFPSKLYRVGFNDGSRFKGEFFLNNHQLLQIQLDTHATMSRTDAEIMVISQVPCIL